MYIYIYKFAWPLGQRRERSAVLVPCSVFYNSIAMAKRILPERFCLESCRPNLPQATPNVARN